VCSIHHFRHLILRGCIEENWPRELHARKTELGWRKKKNHGRMNYKDTKPFMSAFLSVDLVTDFAAFCLTNFIDWRYIWFVFSTQLMNCCPHGTVEGLDCKRPIPIWQLFYKIDLLTDIAALCLTDFTDWRYIHSLVGIFDPACELLSPQVGSHPLSPLFCTG
jgi:hypothetical protein